MAEVTPYRDQITPELGPNTGTDALISAARRVGPLEREAGLAVQAGVSAIGTAAKDVFAQREAVAARREIAAGFESHALMQGQHEADLNQLLSDPELSKDPARLQQALQGFKANVLDPENEKWVSGFTTQQGQEWAALHAGQQGAELLKHAHSMSDIISANEALTSVFGVVNQLSANAIANPMTIDQQLASFDSGVKGLAGTISDPVKRAEFEEKIRNLRGQIAYAGVHSAIETSPAIGRQLAAKYGSIMTPEHQTAAESYATAITKANQQQARIDRSMDRQDEHDAADIFANKITLSMRDANGNPAVPRDFMQNMIRLSTMRVTPGTFERLMGEKDAILREQARGTPTVTDPSVYGDFSQRAALAPDDPQHLTDAQVAQARIDGTLSDHDAAMFRERVDIASKDPGLVQDQKTLNKFIEMSKPPNMTGTDNQSYLAFVKDRSDKFWYQRRLGVSADDLTNPSSSKFLGFMSDADKAAAAAAPAAQAMPSDALQKRTTLAASTALEVVSLMRDNNIEAARQALKSHPDTAGIDPASPDVGAAIVNKSLAAVGLTGTGKDTADSFKNWGFPVDAGTVKAGDVFYDPGKKEAGLLTGAARVSGGVPQVQVISAGAGDARQAIAEISQYARGNAAPGGLSPISRIDPGFASDIARMVRAMPPGIRSQFTIESGFRSPEREAQVYAEQHPGQPVPADSAHSHGGAVDIGKNSAVISWITDHGTEFGVHFPLAGQPGEENHLEPISGGHNGAVGGGGVEWRDARSMQFRRAQAPLDQIKPGWVQRNFGWLTGGSHSASPAQPSDMNPGELQ